MHQIQTGAIGESKIEFEQAKVKGKDKLEHLKREVMGKGAEQLGLFSGTDKKLVGEMQNSIENLERERRARNIIIFNLRESDSLDARERYKFDEEKCRSIFVRELGIQGLHAEKLIR